MPYAPSRTCRTPGCPGITKDKGGFCDACKAKAQEQKRRDDREYDRNRRNRPWGTKVTDSRYKTERWRNLREMLLAREPLCRFCTIMAKYCGGPIRPAVELDHKIPVYKGGDFWSEDNLEPLCKECHLFKSGRDRRKRRSSIPHFVDLKGYSRSFFTGKRIDPFTGEEVE